MHVLAYVEMSHLYAYALAFLAVDRNHGRILCAFVLFGNVLIIAEPHQAPLMFRMTQSYSCGHYPGTEVHRPAPEAPTSRLVPPSWLYCIRRD